ncbi:MAG: hypothetical protein H0A75_07145 [Candidatus Methanofishera endochildressiae]|uniref:Uncharacterized protein n=1 Tax=Candidatus Methanofishera endochildressiae TaxID=2738884 RepID=A0A7Z0MPA5_9GAMM|nr:hypothetical protein [Candidatus Methanofishera endochildressiae]
MVVGIRGLCRIAKNGLILNILTVTSNTIDTGSVKSDKRMQRVRKTSLSRRKEEETQ